MSMSKPTSCLPVFPNGRWLAIIAAALIILCQCYCGRKPGAISQPPGSFIVLLYGAPDISTLCRSAETVEKGLAGKTFVKNLRVTGYAEDEIVLKADADIMRNLVVNMAALAEAIRRDLPDVPEEDMGVDGQKNTIVIASRECHPVNLKADQLMKAAVKDPLGHFIPISQLATIEVRAKSHGLLYKGGRALKVEVVLADSAGHDEAKKSLRRFLAEQVDMGPVAWDLK